jgi:hypothetical protein
MIVKLKLIFLLALAPIISGCSTATVSNNPAAQSKPEESLITPEATQYAVYNAVLKEFIGTRTKMLVLDNSNPSCEGNDLDMEKGLSMDVDSRPGPMREMMPGISEETINDFHHKPSVCLKQSFNLGVKIILLNKQEYNEVFAPKVKNTNVWNVFRNKYPNADGIISLSNVGFNREMNQALVYVSQARDYTDGVGRYYFLSNENGVWRIKKYANVWVS